jgi:hypothetical protein
LAGAFACSPFVALYVPGAHGEQAKAPAKTMFHLPSGKSSMAHYWAIPVAKYWSITMFKQTADISKLGLAIKMNCMIMIYRPRYLAL